MSRRLQPADSLLNPHGSANEWAVAAALEPLDKVASETEARWGIGTLERLVAPDTAARFASARKKLDIAIDAGDWEDVSKRAAVMIRGWQALEAAAVEAGHKPLDVTRFWAHEDDNGVRLLFVQHELDMQAAVAKFPDHRVWSMSEVGRVLSAHSLEAVLASKVKDQFPGATVTDIRTRQPLNDEIPF
jgi:FAD/FMN-containing dehydrogenase